MKKAKLQNYSLLFVIIICMYRCIVRFIIICVHYSLSLKYLYIVVLMLIRVSFFIKQKV